MKIGDEVRITFNNYGTRIRYGNIINFDNDIVLVGYIKFYDIYNIYKYNRSDLKKRGNVFDLDLDSIGEDDEINPTK